MHRKLSHFNAMHRICGRIAYISSYMYVCIYASTSSYSILIIICAVVRAAFSSRQHVSSVYTSIFRSRHVWQKCSHTCMCFSSRHSTHVVMYVCGDVVIHVSCMRSYVHDDHEDQIKISFLPCQASHTLCGHI